MLIDRARRRPSGLATSHSWSASGLTRKLAKIETERRKLLEAYYAGAIDVGLLRSEQQRITSDIREVEERLKNVEATLAEWQEVLAIAFRFATNCGQAYRSANGRTRKLYNSAVFERLTVRNGEITEVAYREPFGALFLLPEFEQGSLERETLSNGVRKAAYRDPDGNEFEFGGGPV